MRTSISTIETSSKDRFIVSTFDDKEIQATISAYGETLRLDIFSIKSIMESLFNALNPQQKENMIKILQDRCSDRVG